MVELVKQPVVELVKQESGDRRIGGCAVGEEGRVARLPSCHQASEHGFVHLVRRPVPAGRLTDLNHHDGSHRKGHQISELARTPNIRTCLVVRFFSKALEITFARFMSID